VDDVGLELGLADLALDAATVDGKVTQVQQELLGTVLAADQVEQRRGIIDEGGPAVAVDKNGVRQERSQEGDVRLDTADAELDQRTQDLATRNLVRRAVAD
jgi:hypothetical protein